MMGNVVLVAMRRQAVADLEAGRELLSDLTRWTKGAYARNAKGDPVTECSADAVCWCSMGALRKVIAESTTADDVWRSDVTYGRLNNLRDILNHASQQSTHSCAHILDVNDQGTHEAVLEVWAKAIEDAKEKLVTAETTAA